MTASNKRPAYTCHARTAAGDPCRMKALKSSRFCFAHSPAHAAKRAQARRTGGQHTRTPHAGDPATIPAKIETVQDARALLDYVKAELLAMDNGIPRARALIALFEAFIKSFEIGEIEQRLAALEALQNVKP